MKLGKENLKACRIKNDPEPFQSWEKQSIYGIITSYALLFSDIAILKSWCRGDTYKSVLQQLCKQTGNNIS